MISFSNSFLFFAITITALLTILLIIIPFNVSFFFSFFFLPFLSFHFLSSFHCVFVFYEDIYVERSIVSWLLVLFFCFSLPVLRLPPHKRENL